MPYAPDPKPSPSSSPADGDDYGLVVAFTDQSPSFVNGFEAGDLWRRMKLDGDTEITATTHVANREVLRRMADAGGWSLDCEPTETDGWDYTTLRKRGAVQ